VWWYNTVEISRDQDQIEIYSEILSQGKRKEGRAKGREVILVIEMKMRT
jgi:hypothetical protein